MWTKADHVLFTQNLEDTNMKLASYASRMFFFSPKTYQRAHWAMDTTCQQAIFALVLLVWRKEWRIMQWLFIASSWHVIVCRELFWACEAKLLAVTWLTYRLSHLKHTVFHYLDLCYRILYEVNALFWSSYYESIRLVRIVIGYTESYAAAYINSAYCRVKLFWVSFCEK